MQSPDTYTLSPEQRKQYEEDGYFVIRKFIDTQVLEKCRERFHQVCSGAVDKGQILIIKESRAKGGRTNKERNVNKLHDIHFDEVFATYTENPRVISVVRQLVGNDVRVVSSVYINKGPGSLQHPPHQDLLYLTVRPAHRAVGVWTAVDTATSHNGALYVLPGTHKPGLLYQHTQPTDAYKVYHTVADETVMKGAKEVILEMSPGDTVVFHPLLVHGSRPNITQQTRNCLAAHFASEQTYFFEVCGGPLAKVAQEVNSVLLGRGWNTTYEELLRFRSKPVSTKPRSKI